MSRKTKLKRRGAEIAPRSDSTEQVVEGQLEPQVVRPAPNVPKQVWLQFQQYAGPIPHPALLEHYERVCPGSADRIVQQFEEQGRHRRKLESRVVTHNMISASVGQVAAFVLFLATIGAGVFLLYNDKTVAGLGSLITAVGGASWVLRKAEVQRRKDLAAKREGR